MSPEMLQILLPALVTCVMIALTHAPLGLEVLKRGIIFIDLAIAQIAGLGLLVAIEVFHLQAPLLQQASALGIAIMASLLFRWVERVTPELLEAVIGSSYVLAASLAMLVLASNPHAGEAMGELLAGQVLFVAWSDLLEHLPVYILVLGCWFLLPKLRTGLAFYLLFALAITSSVQLTGVYVVFASLILPAIAVTHCKKQILFACACGLLSVSTGLIVAAMTDLPAGPLIVLSYCLYSGLIFFSTSLRKRFRTQ